MGKERLAQFLGDTATHFYIDISEVLLETY